MRALCEDGRLSDVLLGERVNLSSTAAARRRKILEERGVIRGYGAVLDEKRLGYSITVLVLIELRSQAESRLKEFEEAALACPSMSYCGFISGESDFLMLINVRSFDDYDNVYRHEIANLPHVGKIRSSFLLREVAKRPIAPAVLDDARALDRNMRR